MNNKSFTLMEMIIVLFIVTLIASLSMFNIIDSKDRIELQNDIEHLGNSFSDLQMISLTTNLDSSIKLNSDMFECIINDEVLYRYSYSNEYHLETNFSNNTISINDNGNVSKGGTVKYSIDDYDKKIIISIGSGRYRIE